MPLLALGWLAHTQLSELSARDSVREMATQVGDLETRLKLEIDNAVGGLALLADSAVLRRYLRASPEAQGAAGLRRELKQLFESHQRAYPRHYELRLLLPDGTEDVRASTADAGNLTRQERDSTLFNDLVESHRVNHVAFGINPDNDALALYLARRIDAPSEHGDGTNQLRGFLSVTIDPHFLQAYTRAKRVGSAGTLFVTDGEGRILFRPNDARLGDALPGGIFAELRKQAATGAAEEIVLNGRKWQFRSRRLHENLYAFAGIPAAELAEVAETFSGQVLLATVLTIVIVTMLLYFTIGRMIVRPISSLGTTARSIASGDLVLDPCLARSDEIGHLAASFKDLHENLQRSNQQARDLAYTDSLTGLANRRRFTEALKHVLRFAERNAQYFALLYVGVSDLKRINDTLGHRAGDQMLAEIATRLRECLSDYDLLAKDDDLGPGHTIARIASDEFAILLSSLTDPRQASVVAKRVLRALAQSYPVAGQELHARAGIGISIFPTDGRDTQDLIKHANMAMHHARRRGDNAYQFFQSSMNAAATRRLKLENDLRKAIEREEFVLLYQPKVDASTGRLVGVEALVRWEHPELGLLAPDRFVPVAEQTGLTAAMGEWVLFEACRQNKEWQASGMPPMTVAVNVSNQQFSTQNVAHLVERALLSSSLLPCYLEIEITETTVMHAQRMVNDCLVAIKAIGAQIAMDDFGTGYSSLAALKSLPIDALKIDKTFVKDIGPEQKEVPIISAIIAMAHSLGLKVVAEGVEEQHQLEYLRRHGCHQLQGYLFGRPMPARQIPALLRRGSLIPGHDAPDAVNVNAASA